MSENSSKEESSAHKFTKSVFIAPKALVRKSLSPVDQMYHSVADLRIGSSTKDTLESKLQEISKKFENLTVNDNDGVDDVAKPQYMAKSLAGLLATASMYAGMDELEDEGEDNNEEVELLNDAGSVIDSSSMANQTLFEVSIEVNADAVSQLSTDSKSRKDLIRERMLKKFTSGEDEEFIEEYPCWLLREIMIQGHVYLTNKHLFYFAFIPKLGSESNMAGSLKFVSGNHLNKSHRYWTVLKGHNLTFHDSSTDLYFPLLTVDIREIRAINIVSNENDSEKFRISLPNEHYVLQADSFHSARHWVSTIKKQVFTSQHSETNTMTVKIPLQNIVDLEDTTVLDKSGTLRVRALEDSDNYAIDEYFFVFFRESAKVIKEKVNVLLKDLELNGSQILINFDDVNSPATSDGKSAIAESSEANYDDETLQFDDNKVTPVLSPSSNSFSIRRAASPLKVTKKLKSMADTLKMVSPTRLSKLEDDIVIEHYSSGLPRETGSEYDKDNKSIISRFTPKKLQNVSQMWIAGPVHFSPSAVSTLFPIDDIYLADSDTTSESNKRFRHHFSFDDTITLLASYHGYLNKNVPTYGKIYISDKNVCFRSLLPGVNTKMILPFEDVENCYKETGFRFGYFGLVIVIQGHEELFLEFSNKNARDDCECVMMKVMDSPSKPVPLKRKSTIEVVHRLSEAASLKLLEEKISEQGFDVPLLVEKNPYYTTVIKPNRSYKFGLLTIGSRGDVQPYIALAKGLIAEGHEVTILTHIEFEKWIVSHGIHFKEISGNPAELISLMVQHGSMNMGLLRDASANFSEWITQLLDSAWKGCQGIDILIESPSAMAGLHIAEALKIPYFRAFTMPWTRTRAYPHAFIVPDQKRGGSYNYFTHVLFENIFWKGISGKVNKWRVESLNLPKTNLVSMQQNRVPFLYNVSPTVFPPSIDFNEWIKVTGYWFLDEKSDYTPPQKLLEFLEKAHKLNKKLVYIGFGSIVVKEPQKMTDTIVSAVQDANIYCVLNKGWSNRFGDPDAKKITEELPECIYNSGDIPHDWLFPKIDAAVHHGGSGTTGASLRAGLPTIIKPFFGDQFFYANRIEDIGAGVALKKLNEKSLSKALKEVTTNTRIIHKAKSIGDAISKEHGVAIAISSIYSELGYARSLIKRKEREDKEQTESTSSESHEDSWLLV